MGTALVAISDGAFSVSVHGAVLGKNVNLRIIDADRDVSDAADKLDAVVQVYRLKTDAELETETIARVKLPVRRGTRSGQRSLATKIPRVTPFRDRPLEAG